MPAKSASKALEKSIGRASGIHNTAVALRTMAELAGEALAAREAAGAGS